MVAIVTAAKIRSEPIAVATPTVVAARNTGRIVRSGEAAKALPLVDREPVVRAVIVPVLALVRLRLLLHRLVPVLGRMCGCVLVTVTARVQVRVPVRRPATRGVVVAVAVPGQLDDRKADAGRDK